MNFFFKKTILIFCLFWIKNQLLFGQKSKNDTILSLNPIEIIGEKWEKYALASKKQYIDSIYLAQNSTQNMGDWLLYNTSAYIKQYGNGMLGSISLRGTGASHTAVVWNGIPINSLTLGEADFGNIPLNNTQKIALHYGGASVWQGSEAIGGAVSIEQNPNWDNQKNITIRQTFGSFGQSFSQIQSNISLKKWEFQNTFSRNFIRNDFSFYNKTQQNTPLETQQNASWYQNSFTQDIYFRPHQSTLLAVKSWGQMRNMHIQPTMSANQDQSTWATQKDDNLRIMLDFQKHFSKWSIFAKQAYLYDYLLFNEQQTTATHRFVTQIKAEKSLKNITFQIGANNTLIRTNVDAYNPQIWENRVDFFMYFLYEISKKYQISFNIRQNVINQNFTPITPNLSHQYFLLKNENQILTLKNTFSRNYKVPTLNDRYWAGSQNPNLKPEDALSGEIGLFFYQKFSKILLTLEATHYQMYVQDWILWQPQGNVWKPENRRNVEVKGIEFSFKIRKNTTQIKNKDLDFSIFFQYAFTQSLNRETSESLTYYLDKKQLPYTPQHRWNAYFWATYKNLFTNISYQYTGERFETLDNANTLLGRLGGFQTINWNIGKNFFWNNKFEFSFDFQIKNLLNENYQNYLFRAMPLRHYAIGLRFKV